MSIKIKTLESAELHPLYRQFDGQNNTQPAFIEFDTRTEELRADYSGEIGGGIPVDVYEGKIKRWKIDPQLTTDEINALLREVAGLLEEDKPTTWAEYRQGLLGELTKIKSQFDAHGINLYCSPDNWGETYILTLCEWEEEIPIDEKNAKKTIWYDWFKDEDTDQTDGFNAAVNKCADRITESAGVLHVSDWMIGADITEEYNLSAYTTDEELKEIIKNIYDYAAGEATLTGVKEYVKQVRDELREGSE